MIQRGLLAQLSSRPISPGLLDFFLPKLGAPRAEKKRSSDRKEQQPAIEGLEWFIMVIIGDS